jgi:hypothetical protein
VDQSDEGDFLAERLFGKAASSKEIKMASNEDTNNSFAGFEDAKDSF